ncbi:MAG: PEGA domain-containing protein [Methanococcoides sp.]|nr:PEGA domain-containing protein [Methanococcoides sp.]
MTKSKIFTHINTCLLILFIFILLISISIPANAGTPKVGVTTSFPQDLSPGENSQLDVKVSEISGGDWMKDVTVMITVSPSDGIYLKRNIESVARIDKLSDAYFSFPINILETAPSGDKVIQITVQYYEMDLFNIDTYGPYYVTEIASFYVKDQYGLISISSSPNSASVYLDGVYKGVAPITLKKIPIGSHTIKLTKSGYNDVSKTVTVSSGKNSLISESLSEQTGIISLSSSPSGVSVYLDGKSKGTTPLILNGIPIGSHTIKLTKSGYNDVSKTVTVSSGKNSLISESLSEQTGIISLSSSPSGVSVYLDGKSKGTTPLILNGIPIGSHTIKLTKSGYNDVFKTVTVSSGKTSSISKNLSLNPILPIGAFLVLFLLFIGIIRAKKSKKNPSHNNTQKSSKNTESLKNIPVQQQKKPETKQTTQPPIKTKEQKNRISTKSAFSYRGATIIHKVKIENPTQEPISDIKVHLFVPDVFLLKDKEKSIPILDSGESKTVTFDIRPSGECGDCNVSGTVNYYDYSKKKRQEIDLETKSLSIICPLLHINEISTKDWRNVVSSLVRTEEATRDISMPAETLFNMTSRVIEDMNMFMLDPVATSTPEMFNGVARFYGVGIKDLKYAAQVEVVGGAKKAKIILKAWAEKEDALTGFYHGMLDEIEKRVQVKGYINENMIQNFYHYGDNIGTQVKDSFVQRSNIGTNSKTCPQCNIECDMNERFCFECGSKLE